MNFNTFSDVEAYLDSLVNYEHDFPRGGTRSRPKLQPSIDAVNQMGLSRSLPRTCHIAGTVGKGSVAGFLESILCAKYSTLSFTSPHLVSVKERVRRNGKPLDDQLWRQGFTAITEALQEEPAIHLTYFESVWVFFLWLSRELHTEAHVVETGLGGQWDATNILETSTAILTCIDFDHVGILGSTLREITLDKCGIIKPNSKVLAAKPHPETQPIILESAAKQNSTCEFYRRDFDLQEDEQHLLAYRDSAGEINTIRLAIPESFQLENAAIAIRAARLVAPEITPEQIRTALRTYSPPARQQILPGSPPVMIDVAHNPVAFKTLADTLHDRYTGKRIIAVLGMMKDKDARSCFTHLSGLVNEVFITRADNPRSCSVKELATIAQECGLQAKPVESAEAAFQKLHGSGEVDLGLIAGSFYLVGEYLSWRARA